MRPRERHTEAARCAKPSAINGHSYPSQLASPIPTPSHDCEAFVSSPVACPLRFSADYAARGAKEPAIIESIEVAIMSTALAFIEPTDTGLIEELSKEIIRNGEKRLMLAVLESATEDFQKYALASDKRGKELFQAAEEWILDTDNPSFFSFENICEHLLLDPSYMRQGFMRWKTAKVAGQVKHCFKSAHRRVTRL